MQRWQLRQLLASSEAPRDSSLDSAFSAGSVYLLFFYHFINLCIFLLIFISSRLRSSTTSSSSFGPSGWAVESSANSIIDDYLTKKYWTFSIIFVWFSILTCVIPISYNLIQDGYKYRLVTPENPFNIWRGKQCRLLFHFLQLPSGKKKGQRIGKSLTGHILCDKIAKNRHYGPNVANEWAIYVLAAGKLYHTDFAKWYLGQMPGLKDPKLPNL